MAKSLEELKDIKDKYGLMKFVLSYEQNQFTRNLIQKIKKSSLEDSMIAVWNFALQQEGKYFLGKEVTRNCWYKGSAIAGMECHSK